MATLDPDAKLWTFYTTDSGLPSNVCYAITKVGSEIWVATQRGIARRLGDGTFRGYARGAGLPADRVRKVYTDDGSRLWLSLIEGGAARVNPASAQ